MPETVYDQLSKRLDTLGVGYPKMDSGVEYTLLKYFFSEEEAGYVAEMEDKYETASEYATRTKHEPGRSAIILEGLAKKSLIFRQHKDGEVRYRPIPVAHGIYEFNVKNLNTKWLPDFFEQVLKGLVHNVFATKVPFFRIVPISQDVTADSKLLQYDDASEMIRKARIVAVTECVCRKVGAVFGNPCKNSLERCLTLNDAADYYIENGIGHQISTEEALKSVEDSINDGLILQVINSKQAEVICACCKCHCGELVLMNMAGVDAPGRKVVSNYVCLPDRRICDQSCSDVCVGACAAGAWSKTEAGELRFSGKHCVGCGQCVRQCPKHALKLVAKAEINIFEPAADMWDGYTAIAKERSAQAKP